MTIMENGTGNKKKHEENQSSPKINGKNRFIRFFHYGQIKMLISLLMPHAPIRISLSSIGSLQENHKMA